MSLTIRIGTKDYEVSEERLKKFKSMHRYFPEKGHWKLMVLNKTNYRLVNLDINTSIKNIKEQIQREKENDIDEIWDKIYSTIGSSEFNSVKSEIKNVKMGESN